MAYRRKISVKPFIRIPAKADIHIDHGFLPAQECKPERRKIMTKDITIENTTRTQIAAFLPDAIELAVKSYREHMVKENESGTGKGNFEAHHKAAKIAISHIELLIKLAKWADLPDQSVVNEIDAQYLKGLMDKAEAEIEAYEEES
jgi:hypothetical protein